MLKDAQWGVHVGVEVLVAAVGQDVRALAAKMNLQTEAVVVNQCGHDGFDEFFHRGRRIACYYRNERGVGRSRNLALAHSSGDICLFADEDIVYVDGYEGLIEEEFAQNPGADMLLLNIDVEEARRTYHNTGRKRVHTYNSGRYGAVSFALRGRALRGFGVTFSLLFGGGAAYGAGEDSLFLRELLKKGCRAYTSCITVGKEEARESSWFHGYDEKFFHDKGVLYHFLYGKMAVPVALRFLTVHSSKLCKDISFAEAFRFMGDGIREGKELKRC